MLNALALCMQSRMHSLLEALEKPQQKLKVVHVAGSKGKGSVAAMLTGILTKSGYKVGTYTRYSFSTCH